MKATRVGRDDAARGASTFAAGEVYTVGPDLRRVFVELLRVAEDVAEVAPVAAPAPTPGPLEQPKGRGRRRQGPAATTADAPTEHKDGGG